VITLAIETSTERGSIAICDGEKMLFNESFSAERGHSSQLFLALERALACVRCEQIVVGLGPGSYSGARIAISAAIGVSLGTNARLLGISSLLAIETDATHFCVIGDARRQSFYFAEIANSGFVAEPQLLSREQLAERLDALPCPLFSSAPIAEFSAAQIAFPSAEKLARLALAQRGIVARDQLEPLYLREPHITAARKIQS